MLNLDDIFIKNKYNSQETDTYSGEPIKIYLGKLKEPVNIEHEYWNDAFTVNYEYGMVVNDNLIYLADFMFDNLSNTMRFLKNVKVIDK